MPNENYYDILGISYTATQEEIKNAYRNKAKQYHPDTNQSSNAEDMMKIINIAYEVLSDLSKRKEYDEKLTKENKVNTSSASTPDQTMKSTHSPYSSYTKTREESEYDFDDWLKEYLKRRRENYNYKEEFIKYDINTLKILKNKIIQYYNETNFDDNDEFDKVKILRR